MDKTIQSQARNNTVVISGAAGFLGSHLSQKFLNEGYSVIGVDNLVTGRKSNLDSFKDNSNFKFLEYDVINPLEMNEEIFAIVHMASPASPNKKSKNSYINHPIETLLVNSQGTHNLLNLGKEKGARFVYASSSEVYGNPAVTPQTEGYFGNVNPNGVRSVYDEGKRFGEAITMAFHRAYGIDTRIMRIFNTYGERLDPEDGRVVSNFIKQAIRGESITIYGKGDQTRSFCYVSDLIDGIFKLTTTNDLSGEVVNLGNPEEYTIAELATIVKTLTNSNSKIVYESLPQDDPMQRRPDITKAEELLDFHPSVKLEEGLSRTIKYYKGEK